MAPSYTALIWKGCNAAITSKFSGIVERLEVFRCRKHISRRNASYADYPVNKHIVICGFLYTFPLVCCKYVLDLSEHYDEKDLLELRKE